MQKQFTVIALVATLLFTAACSTPRAEADILLKAVGKNEISLRPKTMDSQISIRGQIAQIKTTLTMASELDIQSEADFEYTVPDNTLVTYFAYWYKGKKVVARIVTKERAAEIYRIVSNTKVKHHRRWTNADPAIVEMTDKNTFHVRIFPIEANADLKVEIHSVQLLNSDAKGSVFTFPLKAPEKNKGTFEKIHLHLQLYPGSNVTDISNNYNLPLIRSNNIQTLDLQQQNWRAPQDLEVRFTRPIKALNADLYSARAGGANGFFALTLVPSQDIPHPLLEIQGVKTWQLFPAHLTSMKKHVPVLITGRYAGSGVAKVLLHGYGENGVLAARNHVEFSAKQIQPNPAAKLWAKLRMQELATNANNRSTVTELSKRFNLPSKYTSWLALPEEGRKVYEEYLKQHRDEVSFHRWKSLVIQGKGNTAEANSYLTTYKSYMKGRGHDPNPVINERIFYLIEGAAYRIRWAAGRGELDAQRRKQANGYMHMLQTFFTDPQSRYAQKGRLQVRYAHVQTELLPEYFALENTKGQYPYKWRRINQKLATAYRELNAEYSKITGNKTSGKFHLSHDKDSFVRTRQTALDDQLANEISEHGRTQKSQQLINEIRRFQSHSNSLYAPKQTLFNVLYEKASDAKKNKITDYKGMATSLKSTSKHIGKELGIPQSERQEVLFKAILPIIYSHIETYFSDKYSPVEHQKEMSQIRTELTNVASVLGISFENLVYKNARYWANAVRYTYPYKIAREKLKENPDKQRLELLVEQYSEATRIVYYKPEKFEQVLGYRLPHQQKESLDEQISEAMSSLLQWKYTKQQWLLDFDKSLKNQDAGYQKSIEAKMADLRQKYKKLFHKQISADSYSAVIGLQEPVSAVLEREYSKENPNQDRIKEMKALLIEKAKNEYIGTNINNPVLYGNLRAQRLELRANREKIEEKIKSESDPSQVKALKDQKATIMAQQKKLIARMGDPLISVQAENATSVVALMPDGQIKQLVFDVQKERWEARFDIPASAAEGKYTIQIIVVHKDGSRQMLAMHYSVDLTPPVGNAQMKVIDKNYSGQKVLRLEVQTDENAARVSALLPWNQKVELMPSENTSNQFYALSPVPESYSKSTFLITFVLTDKAHNRAEITVEQTL